MWGWGGGGDYTYRHYIRGRVTGVRPMRGNLLNEYNYGLEIRIRLVLAKRFVTADRRNVNLPTRIAVNIAKEL
jgi:hypothetical protein